MSSRPASATGAPSASDRLLEDADQQWAVLGLLDAHKVEQANRAFRMTLSRGDEPRPSDWSAALVALDAFALGLAELDAARHTLHAFDLLLPHAALRFAAAHLKGAW